MINYESKVHEILTTLNITPKNTLHYQARVDYLKIVLECTHLAGNNETINMVLPNTKMLSGS